MRIPAGEELHALQATHRVEGPVRERERRRLLVQQDGSAAEQGEPLSRLPEHADRDVEPDDAARKARITEQSDLQSTGSRCRIEDEGLRRIRRIALEALD